MEMKATGNCTTTSGTMTSQVGDPETNGNIRVRARHFPMACKVFLIFLLIFLPIC